ncbi:unnamed protein product [Merluccius merluccius]
MANSSSPIFRKTAFDISSAVAALLAVVVISCMLGGILLIFVVSLIICSSPYPAQEQIPGPWSAPGLTSIPRATTNWDSTQPIEMSEANSTNDLVDRKSNTNGVRGSYDLNPAMRTFKGKNPPSRYSYLVQGHENPYFLAGEDKKTSM